MDDLERMYRVSRMFGVEEIAHSRTREVNRLQGILDDIAAVLKPIYGDDVYRATQETLPKWIGDLVAEVQRLRLDPRSHICIEPVLRAERDQARRDLDRKDHECAALKAELLAREQAGRIG